MQTQCPRCKAKNEIKSETIAALEGRLRCPACDYKYELEDKMSDEFEPDIVALDKKHSFASSGDMADRSESKIEPRIASEVDHDEHNIRFLKDEYDEQWREPKFSLQENADEGGAIVDDHGELDAPIKDADVSSAKETIHDKTTSETDETIEREDLEDEKDAIATFPSLKETIAPDEKTAPSLNIDSADNSLINDDDFGDDKPASGFMSAIGRFFSFLFWTAAAIALTYLLFTQISDRLYPAYKNHPTVQGLRDSVCGYLPCAVTTSRVDEFEVVVSRMDEVGGPTPQSHLSIFLMNKAAQAQAYPNILVTLKRLDGEISAQRVVSPSEYFTSHDGVLKSDAAGDDIARPLIKPGKLGKILIKLNNPPEDAVGFEVRVVG